jgi:selenide,water dikinase
MLQNAVALALSRGPIVPPPYPEDCAIVEIDSPRLLFTTDLAPLVGVDLAKAGRIAALHSMSDIYASGGIPKWALVNLVADAEHLGEFAEEVLAGILNECAAEGAQVLGGQTILGREAMAGLTVIGLPRSSRILRKGGSQQGDLLLLSKPLGVGLILRGYKLGLLHEAALEEALTTLLTSNACASEAALDAGVHACTDVTGFGLLGHLAEMLAPHHGATLNLSRIPILPPAAALPNAALHTAWIENNYQYATAHREISGIREPHRIAPLLDPQTNGGLLVSAREIAAEKLNAAGFSVVGRVTETPSFEISE